MEMCICLLICHNCTPLIWFDKPRSFLCSQNCSLNFSDFHSWNEWVIWTGTCKLLRSRTGLMTVVLMWLQFLFKLVILKEFWCFCGSELEKWWSFLNHAALILYSTESCEMTTITILKKSCEPVSHIIACFGMFYALLIMFIAGPHSIFQTTNH